MKIRKNQNSYNLVCFYPGRAPQKAISKSTVRTFIASANRKHGQSYTFESSTTLFFPVLVFTFVFKLFIQLHTILRIIGVSHWVYKPLIFKIFFQISKLFAREGKQFTPFTSLVAKLKEIKCPSQSTESLKSRWKVFISSSVYMTIDPGTSSVVATLSCLVEHLHAIFWTVFTGFSSFYASLRICSSFRNREEPLTHFQKRFFLFLALQKLTMVFKKNLKMTF